MSRAARLVEMVTQGRRMGYEVDVNNLVEGIFRISKKETKGLQAQGFKDTVKSLAPIALGAGFVGGAAVSAIHDRGKRKAAQQLGHPEYDPYMMQLPPGPQRKMLPPAPKRKRLKEAAPSPKSDYWARKIAGGVGSAVGALAGLPFGGHGVVVGLNAGGLVGEKAQADVSARKQGQRTKAYHKGSLAGAGTAVAALPVAVGLGIAGHQLISKMRSKKKARRAGYPMPESVTHKVMEGKKAGEDEAETEKQPGVTWRGIKRGAKVGVAAYLAGRYHPTLKKAYTALTAPKREAPKIEPKPQSMATPPSHLQFGPDPSMMMGGMPHPYQSPYPY